MRSRGGINTRGVPGVRGAPPGRHSSYTPASKGNQSDTNGELKTSAGDIINSKRGVSPQKALSTSAPVNGRTHLPKFEETNGSSFDEPTPPPRSPHVSPRISTLPKLPPRPHSTESTQSQPNTPAQNTSEPEADSKRAALRHKCLEEIYQTEKDYIDDLETLINVSVFFTFLNQNKKKNI